ncbi:hypothetical protein LL270_09165 [Pseudomonas aestusnigri]|uniref:hypothetical protein n=1 Tax=Halopseudomonas aestusnigri TaxID=857252 RepID=UPI001D193A23|nr:hypothetical protein [Halopseudomonas aestusnigri]MCC4260824.1 hypothetical protein [Halopseudomonas aestusnigri]
MTTNNLTGKHDQPESQQPKCCTCRDSGFVGDSDVCPECVGSWLQQPVAEVKYGGYASGNELVWTKGAGLQLLPAGTKLYAASIHAPTPVAYLDVGAGGYMYLGTDLTEDQVGSLPWGRHMLAIVGTYGADGYVPAYRLADHRKQQEQPHDSE